MSGNEEQIKFIELQKSQAQADAVEKMKNLAPVPDGLPPGIPTSPTAHEAINEYNRERFGAVYAREYRKQENMQAA